MKTELKILLSIRNAILCLCIAIGSLAVMGFGFTLEKQSDFGLKMFGFVVLCVGLCLAIVVIIASVLSMIDSCNLVEEKKKGEPIEK